MHSLPPPILHNYKKIIDVCITLIIGIALYKLCYQLFYYQSIQYTGVLGNYQSDLPTHIQFGLNGGNYSCLYWIIGIIVRNLGNSSIAVLQSIFVVITWYFTAKLVTKISGFNSIISIYVAVGLIFLSNICIPTYNFYYTAGYKSTFTLTTQPWHNITYIDMRLFAVITIYYFVDLYKNYQKEVLWTNYLFVTSFLFLSVCIKPNFLISYALALLISLIIDFAKDSKKMDNIWKYIILGSTVFPSCVILFIQSRILYPSGITGGDTGTSGITLRWFATELFSSGLVLGTVNIILGLAFPMLVLILNRGRDKLFKFIWIFFVATFIVINIFTETGPRAFHMNFYWGVLCASYLLFLFSIAYFMKNWKENFPKARNISLLYKFVGVFLFIAHTLSGLFYFDLLLKGSTYLI